MKAARIGFGMAFVLVMASFTVGPTQAMPAPQGVSSLATPSSTYVGFQEVYYNEFNDNGRTPYTITTAGGGTQTVTFSGTMTITSQGPGGNGQGSVVVYSDRMGLDLTPHYFDVPAYEIETRYRHLADSKWFRIIDNEEVILYAYHDGTNQKLSIYYRTSLGLAAQEDLQNLVNNHNYDIKVTVKLDSSGAKRATYWVKDLTTQASETYSDRRLFDAPTDYLIFGDVSNAADYGKGAWFYIKVTGRTTARFSDTFGDGDMHDWRIYADEHASLSVASGKLKLLSATQQDLAFAFSQPFDYRRTCANPSSCQSNEFWTITFDFRILSANNAWLIVFANDQALLQVSGTILNYYWVSDDLSTGTSVNFYTMTVNAWVSIRLVQTSIDAYDIYVADPNTARVTGAQFQFTNGVGTEAFRLGDFSSNDRGEAEWDNFKALSTLGTSTGTSTAVDDDSDGLSDQFENLAGQTVWAEDFEPIGVSATGGADKPVHYGWVFSDPWEWGAPADTLNVNDPKEGYADSLNLIGTNIDGYYSMFSTDVRATSPAIDFTSVPDIGTPRLVYNIWWDLFGNPNQGNYDKCEVKIQVDGGTPTTLKSYDVNSAGIGRWTHEEMDLGGSPQGHADVRLIFSITENGDTLTDYGCYIDDIQILAPSDKDEDDMDADFLLDGQERYWAGTSPFVEDTDGDSLTDYQELTDEDIGDAAANLGGRADPLRVDLFYEVDRMCKWTQNDDCLSGAYDLEPSVRANVISDLARNGIRGHFRDSDDDVPYADDVGTYYACQEQYVGTWLGPLHRDYKTWPGKYWHMMVVWESCFQQNYFGLAQGNLGDPSGFFVIYKEDTENHENLVGDTTWTTAQIERWLVPHEHGHCLSLGHTSSGTDWMRQAGGVGDPDNLPLTYTDGYWAEIEFSGLDM